MTDLDSDQDQASSSVPPSSPIRDPDPRQSLSHVLLSDLDRTPERSPERSEYHHGSPEPSQSSGRPVRWVNEHGEDHIDDDGSVQNDPYIRITDVDTLHNMVSGNPRRAGNPTIGSAYSGNKIKHLKKEDGIPLWRKDIQYEFLRRIFCDEQKVFTNEDGTPGYTFADIYIDALAKSSKTSKILKDKLLTDRPSALSMSMICLLVNVGRMNTTLNFFPEMRAQLRTYHSIPSLQAHQDPNAYKQLQDAPRLKSILKGASEDLDQPNTLEKLMKHSKPRTNAVHLVFLLSQYAPKISEVHFQPPRDFFDLVMRSTLSSESRAIAFLWLMWWYLESDFSKADALRNPFGRGVLADGGSGIPCKVPPLENLTEEQALTENVDTPEELEYGEHKRLERKRLLEDDEAGGRNSKRVRRTKKDIQLANHHVTGSQSREGSTHLPGEDDSTVNTPASSPQHDGDESRRLSRRELAAHRRTLARSDSEGTRSLSPSRRSGHHTGYDEGDDHLSVDVHPRRSSRRVRASQGASHRNPARTNGPESSPAPQTNAQPTEAQPRRSARTTAHSRINEQVKREKVDTVLEQWYSEEMIRQQTRRESEDPIMRSWRRILMDGPDYDSEDEGSHGRSGLGPTPDEPDDFGEEARRHMDVLTRGMEILDGFRREGVMEKPRQGISSMRNELAEEVKAGRTRFRQVRPASGSTASSGHPSRRRSAMDRRNLDQNPSEKTPPRQRPSRKRTSVKTESRAKAANAAEEPAIEVEPRAKRRGKLSITKASRSLQDELDCDLLGEKSGNEDGW